MGAQVILAGPDGGALMAAAYPAFAAAGFDVAAVAGTESELAELVAAAGPTVLAVVVADLYPTATTAAAALAALAPARVAVLLPAAWEAQREVFAALPNLARGFTAPVSWPQVAAELRVTDLPARGPGTSGEQTVVAKTEGAAARGMEAERPAEDEGHCAGLSARRAEGGRVVAFWSGPAGGTGRTTLALGLALLAAQRGMDALLLALAEPAVSVVLRLPRVPNVTLFFASDPPDLTRAGQRLGWQGPDGVVGVDVVLGPARPQDGVAEREQLRGLLTAARAGHGLVVLDLPALTPGGNVWALEPLMQADDVVLVAAPTAGGIAATVEALGTLRDLGVAARRHVLLNHRAPRGLTPRDFAAGVAALWGFCPEVVAEVGFVPGLSGWIDRGELATALLEGERETAGLAGALQALGQAAAGLPPAEQETGPTTAGGVDKPEGRRRSLGRLITVEVTD